MNVVYTQFKTYYWMAKANDYQHFPMDRLKQQVLTDAELIYW